MTISLHCRLEGEASYPTGQPVTIRFILENKGDEEIAVLKWDTPLEGLVRDCLHVTRDGQPVGYEGIIGFYFRADAASHARISPGESVQAEFDLRAGYEANTPGRYEVRVATMVWLAQSGTKEVAYDQAFELESSPLVFSIEATAGDEPALETSLAAPPPKGPPKPPPHMTMGLYLEGGTKQQRRDAKKAFNDAKVLCRVAKETLASQGSKFYEKWFGSETVQRRGDVRGAFHVMDDSFDKDLVVYDLRLNTVDPKTLAPYCVSGRAGYAVHYNPPKPPYKSIGWCQPFFDAPQRRADVPTDVPEGVPSKDFAAVHEHFHAATDISGGGEVYGRSNCLKLAKSDPDKAIKNADNYAWCCADLWNPLGKLHYRRAMASGQNWIFAIETLPTLEQQPAILAARVHLPSVWAPLPYKAPKGTTAITCRKPDGLLLYYSKRDKGIVKVDGSTVGVPNFDLESMAMTAGACFALDDKGILHRAYYDDEKLGKFKPIHNPLSRSPLRQISIIEQAGTDAAWLFCTDSGQMPALFTARIEHASSKLVWTYAGIIGSEKLDCMTTGWENGTPLLFWNSDGFLWKRELYFDLT